MCACVRACVGACVRACVRVCVCMRVFLGDYNIIQTDKALNKSGDL